MPLYAAAPVAVTREWQCLAPLPWPTWLDGNGGHPEEYCRRLVIDAICFVADNGNKWRPAGGGTLIAERTHGTYGLHDGSRDQNG